MEPEDTYVPEYDGQDELIPSRDPGLEDALNEETDQDDPIFDTVASLFASAWDQFCATGDEIATDDQGIPKFTASSEANTLHYLTRSHLLVIVRVELLPEPGYDA